MTVISSESSALQCRGKEMALWEILKACSQARVGEEPVGDDPLRDASLSIALTLID